MNKLKKKVFITIFMIFTILIMGVLIVTNYYNYREKKDSITSILIKMSEGFGKNNEFKDNKNINPPNDNFDNIKRIYLDRKVYTILLDENKQVQELITHTEEEIDEDKILDVANEIIRNHQDKIYLGNLYYNKYSYAINDKTNLLIIVSNEEINHELTSNLIISIIIFILLELIILFVSKILTTWIIKPGVESFLKQKQFVADASHELKTPLSVIMTNLSVYEETKDEKWLNNIKEESERMNKLITNLLDLASLEEKKDIRKYQNINLSKLVERSILTFDGLFYENNIKVEYYLDEDIYFNCNPDEIKQMIGILLDNAIKHSSSKGNVIITLSKDKFKIILEVKNKGRAITKGMEDKIFERFYRDDEARNRNDNRYGLGLSIAKQIVINHNGEISVSSNNGYTTFKVKLNQK